MEIVLMLLCVAGLSFVIKETEGPFGLFSMFRNLLAKVPVLGPMFFQTLSCNFCVGFWASVAVFVLSNGFSFSSLGEILVWALGGGTFNALFGKVMDKLDIKLDASSKE